MNILLIEDDSLLASAFTRLLSRRGHSVHHVTGIGAAFDYISDLQGKPDVVITDREVVGGDAWAFVNQAVKLGHLPDKVIYMSGKSPLDVPKIFFHKGADSPSRLVDLINGQ